MIRVFFLHKVTDKLLAVAWQEVNDRNLDHSVAAGCFIAARAVLTMTITKTLTLTKTTKNAASTIQWFACGICSILIFYQTCSPLIKIRILLIVNVPGPFS